MYDRKALQYIKKRDDVVMQIENHAKADNNYYLEAKKALDVAQRAYEIFESSKQEEKRQFLTFMLQNSTLDGRLVKYSLLKPFDTILNYTDRQSWLGRWDDFRTAPWQDIIEYPEVVMQQTQQLLTIFD